MLEPGLDKHLWESWWQQFDDDVQNYRELYEFLIDDRAAP